jgi:hypothetical protein
MIWVVVVCLLVTAFCVGLAAYCVDTTAKALEFARLKHDECHQHTKVVAEYVATVIGKHVLQAAADKWDSVEEQMHIKTLAREKYEPEGPSVPAIWMRELADSMDMSL